MEETQMKPLNILGQKFRHHILNWEVLKQFNCQLERISLNGNFAKKHQQKFCGRSANCQLARVRISLKKNIASEYLWENIAKKRAHKSFAGGRPIVNWQGQKESWQRGRPDPSIV